MITLLHPFYSWGIEYFARGVAAGVGVGALMLLLFQQRTVTQRAIIIALAWLLLAAWQLLPFRPNIAIGPGVATILLVGLFLLLDDVHKHGFLRQTARIFAVTGALSFVIVVLLALGFELPYYRLEQTFRLNPQEFFYLYPGTVILSSQAFPLPSGGTLFRSSGILAEPGHFGVACGLLLAANSFRLITARSKLLLLGGLSTFSGSFFAILGAGVLINLIRGPWLSVFTARLVSGLFLLLAGLTILFSFSTEEFRYRVLWKRIESGHTIHRLYEGRASESFNRTFSLYASSNESIIGLGPGVEDVPSDWRREVVRYGWIIIPMYLLFYGSIFSVSKAPRTTVYHVAATLLIVALHRSAYMDTLFVIAITASALSGGHLASAKRKDSEKN